MYTIEVSVQFFDRIRMAFMKCHEAKTRVKYYFPAKLQVERSFLIDYYTKYVFNKLRLECKIYIGYVNSQRQS